MPHVNIAACIIVMYKVNKMIKQKRNEGGRCEPSLEVRVLSA